MASTIDGDWFGSKVIELFLLKWKSKSS